MTRAIDVDCDGCGEPAGKRCVGDVFCRERCVAAARKTRDENRRAREKVLR